MKLLLACTAVVLLSSAVELARPMRCEKNSIGRIYRDANITSVPRQLLEVSFEDFEIAPGMEICPEDAIERPTIAFDCEPGCYYTFLAINMDFSPDPIRNPSLIDLHVNLNCGDSDFSLEDSCEIASWVGPAPKPGTGLNRYVMHIYRQLGVIDTTDKTLRSYEINRLGFPFEEFVEAYLSSLIAGNFFLAQYPLKCCAVSSKIPENC